MLLLESFVHRQTLAEIIARWMVDRPQPGDVELLKRIVNFNMYATRIWLDQLGTRLLNGVHGSKPTRWSIISKAGLKDYAVEHLTYTNPRIDQMCAKYRRFPEDFYREAPIDGNIYVDAARDGLLLGSSRIKRFRRIAEKGSRRIVDYMLKHIRANADVLAAERARGLGIPKDLLLTNPSEQAEEFAHAERRVIKSIKRGTIHTELPQLAIPDIAGIKVIAENEALHRLLDKVVPELDGQVVEVERHSGLYQAVNVRLVIPLPRKLLEARPPNGHYRKVLAFRGFDLAKLDTQYAEFLEQAEDTVGVEIIVANFEQFLESEIGRSIHEERVLAQRANREYNGFLGTNVRYLMEFILALCRAPKTTELDEVPIKLWVKYMPDTIEQVLFRLNLDDAVYFDTIPEPPDGPSS